MRLSATSLSAFALVVFTYGGLQAGSQWTSPNHYRILLTVDNRGVAQSNAPASVNVDFPQKLASLRVKGSFDENTVEVFAYDSSGKPRVFDSARKGYEKYLLPWRFDKYFGVNYVTLNFVIPTEACTRFAVYFDTKQSHLGKPKRYSGLVGDGDRFKVGYSRREIGASHMCSFCDFDGDGDLDLMKVTNEPFIYYYENVGHNRYVDRGRLTSNGSLFMMPRSGNNRTWPIITFFDWDGDRDQDLFVASNDGPGQGDLLVYENTTRRGGHITFTPRGAIRSKSGKILGDSWFAASTVVDWDGDGKNDILATPGGVVQFYKNIGAAKDIRNIKLADPVPLMADGKEIKFSACRAECADIDGDGDLDLFVETMGSVEFYENIGTRTNPKLQKGVQMPNLCLGYTGVKVADFDGDGLLDYVTSSAWEIVPKGTGPRRYAQFYKNVGTKTHPKFEERDAFHGCPYTEQFQLADAARQNAVRAVDWDDDGKTDLIAVRGATAELFRNVGDNLFSVFAQETALLSDLGNYPRIYVCDWNNDGKKDLVVTTLAGYITVYINEGTNTTPKFDAGTKLLADGKPIQGNNWCSVLVCDWDNDGKKDVILGMAGGGGVKPREWPHINADPANDQGFLYYRNIGTDAAPVLAYPKWVGPGNGKSINYTRPNLGSFADWDGDGKKDFIVASFENSIMMYLNQRSGAPGDEPHFVGPNEGTTLLTAWTVQQISGVDAIDFNGDGDIDLLTGQGHGGVGLRFYEHDFIQDNLNDTHPRVALGRAERISGKMK
jgi:hypothetical protein